jgi:hypothetical protein
MLALKATKRQFGTELRRTTSSAPPQCPPPRLAPCHGTYAHRLIGLQPDSRRCGVTAPQAYVYRRHILEHEDNAMMRLHRHPDGRSVDLMQSG